jgi:hypothetical protein
MIRTLAYPTDGAMPEQLRKACTDYQAAVDRHREAAQRLAQSYGRVEAGKRRDVIEAKKAMSLGTAFKAHHTSDALAEQQAQSVTVQAAQQLVNEAEAVLRRTAKEKPASTPRS